MYLRIVRGLLSQHLNPSQFSPDDSELFFTVGDHAKVKIFVLPVPETPSSSSTGSKLDASYKEPKVLTHIGAASGLQPLKDGRLVFSHNSLTKPNDVFILEASSGKLSSGKTTIRQITEFTAKKLEGKKLSPGEEVWFEGANGRQVQGWIVTPPGFKKGEEKKWPVSRAMTIQLYPVAQHLAGCYAHPRWPSGCMGGPVVDSLEPASLGSAGLQ
jgi:dipeptidyl aminopeptidase/acylaminoacyl peptidase